MGRTKVAVLILLAWTGAAGVCGTKGPVADGVTFEAVESLFRWLACNNIVGETVSGTPLALGSLYGLLFGVVIRGKIVYWITDVAMIREYSPSRCSFSARV